MRRDRPVARATAALILGAAWMGFAAAPAAGESIDPPVAATAWYWEDKQSQELTLPDGSKFTVENPNPFCPGPGSALGEPSQTCADGRLPVEIQGGDYKTPNKLSAVSFDLFTVPVGSTVTEFTVTFLEAKAGCYDTGNPPPSNVQCEHTDPINIEGKQLQACLVTEIFGEGDGRQYKEIPKYTCSSSDPVAKRKEVKPKKNNPDAEPQHVWTFDLTPFAQRWVEKFTVVTSIMITGVAPKDAGANDNWRVVLAGPKFKNGVVTELTYEPPPPGSFGGGGSIGTSPVTTTTTTTGTDFGTSTTDFGTTGGGGTTTGGGTDPVDTGEAPAEDPGEQAAELQDPVGLPWYMVAAILLGIVAFSLVRRAVIEAATGIRPDGVLTQIHRINAERKGIGIADSAGEPAGALAGLSAALGSFGSRVSSIGSKVSTVTGKLFRKGRA